LGIDFGPEAVHPMAFMYRPALDEWKAWFKGWRHLMMVVFICEDFPWWETHYNERTAAEVTAQQVVQKWLEGSSLDRFEIWAGVNGVELSREFKMVHTCTHQLKCVDTHTIFGRAENRKEWEVLQVQPMHFMILDVKLDACKEMCWICQALCTSESLPVGTDCLHLVKTLITSLCVLNKMNQFFS
jgi:hypothetical protein